MSDLKSTAADRAAVLGWHEQAAEEIMTRDSHPDYFGFNTADAQHIVNLLEALTHATLAAVEQQKIGNLIRYMEASVGDLRTNLETRIEEELGL